MSMTCKIYLSESTDPWFNLATEDWLFHDNVDCDHILFLWRNAETVVIGRSQNPWVECHLEKMEADGVKLARRQSGGGAVFHDLGNTNFTFISRKSSYDKARNIRIVIAALAQLGIQACAEGRNDLVVSRQGQSRKISGSAFKEKADRAFHHGTLLINANLIRLQEYLHPNKKKMAAKGIQSIRSRVANLVEFNEALDHETVVATLSQCFMQEYGVAVQPELLSVSSLRHYTELNERVESLQSWQWLYGETLPFTHQLEQRFDWGMVDIRLQVEAGLITQAQVFSDSLVPDFIAALQTKLADCYYQAEALSERLLLLAQSFPQQQSWCDDLIAFFADEVFSY